MKKRTLLTATAVTLICLGGQSITVQAAPKNMAHILSDKNGNRVIISYGSGCSQSLQDILNQLSNCIPNIPEQNIPEQNIPDQNIPENDSTEDNNPETDSSEGQHAYIQEVVDLVNAERAKEGLAPLTIDTKVQAAAQIRAQECEQRFSHTRPNGSSFATALKEQNVSYRNAGENIAWGQKTPQEVVTAWMNSAGHRANILNKNFTTIGVGYYENARGTDYWCQLFTR